MRLICSCFLVPGPEFNQQWFIPFFVLLLLSGQDRGYVGIPMVCFLLSFLHLCVKQTLTVAEYYFKTGFVFCSSNKQYTNRQ